MNAWLRRHARVLAASIAVVLLGTLACVVRSAGPTHVQPTRALAQVRAITPIVLPVAQRRRARAQSRAAAAVLTTGAAVRSGGPAASSHRRATPAARPSAGRAGLPSPAPTTRSESLALRQIAGVSLTQVTSRPVCPRAAPGHATCAAETLVLRSTGAPVRPNLVRSGGARPASSAASVSPPQPSTAAYLQQAYDLSYLSQTKGSGDTVAIVDAFDDPTAQQDLDQFRSANNLRACDAGCFQKVGQDGSPSDLPVANTDWRREISLDLDAVSAICPNCNILLVEANSDQMSDLESAMKTAAGAHPNQISASWYDITPGVPSGLQPPPGIATVAATGDSGYVGPGEDSYPAALPGVTAAGGTTLSPATASGARGFGEAAWSGGGSGCDSLFGRPGYQPAAGCAGRAYADLSADADPSTGLSVVDNGIPKLVGGTSLSAPMIAAYYAITGVTDTTAQWAYRASSALNDVVSGFNGNCSASIAYICDAGTGYDGPTGVGSISGSVVAGAPGIGGPSVPPSNGSTGNTYTAGTSTHAATIDGGIYRNGLDTKWWIEYGTDTSYGSQSAPADIGAGSTPVAVTGYLSQLSPGTTYHYRIVAQNSVDTTYGYDYTLTTQAAPVGAPTAAFAFTTSASSPTPRVAISFDASSSRPTNGGTISNYHWSWGDGTTSDTSNPVFPHTYSARGTYSVTLTITSSGQSDSSTQTVTVDSPTASFVPSVSAVPVGTAVSFDASASKSPGGSITDYNWNFGDGSSADAGTSATTSHTFTAPGSYNVTLTTTDDLDVSVPVTETITVAAFTATGMTSTIPAPNSPVTFTATGTGDTYSWDFGDNTPAGSGSSVPHTYSARGRYTVTLTIQTGSTTSTTTGTVTVDTPPTAAFAAPAPAPALPGAPVNFDASGSTPPTNGTIAHYTWDFGDGTQPQDTGSAATTKHSFRTPGVYTVTLTATDELGGTSAPATEQVTIDQPSPTFTIVSAGSAPNAAVTFDASGTSDPGSSPITDYGWDFGDGTGTTHLPNPTAMHTYATAGTYTVTLTATDKLGLSGTFSRQVVVSPPAQTTGAPPTTTTTTTPTPTPTPVPAPVTTPAPTKPSPPPSAGSSTPLVLRLSVAGRQRLATIVAHGLRLGIAVNQRTRASYQISIPRSETRQATGRAGRNPKATIVLLHATQNYAAGARTIVLKLSRGAVRQLAGSGPLVLTVRITLTGANGKTLTRTARITLTR